MSAAFYLEHSHRSAKTMSGTIVRTVPAAYGKNGENRLQLKEHRNQNWFPSIRLTQQTSIRSQSKWLLVIE